MPTQPHVPPFETPSRGGALQSAPLALQSSYHAAKTDIDGLRAKLAAFRQQPLTSGKAGQSPRHCMQLQLQSLEQCAPSSICSAPHPSLINPTPTYPQPALQSPQQVTNVAGTCSTVSTSAFEGYFVESHEPSRPTSSNSKASLDIVYLASRPGPASSRTSTIPPPAKAHPGFSPSVTSYPLSTSSSTAAMYQAVQLGCSTPPPPGTASATAYSDMSNAAKYTTAAAAGRKKACKNQAGIPKAPGSGAGQRKGCSSGKRYALFIQSSSRFFLF
jgi:hypothetical protein